MARPDAITRAARRLGLSAVSGVAIAALAATAERDAGACSCRGPELSLLGPERASDVPLNTKVRIQAPASSGTGAAGPAGGVFLRAHGQTKTVSTTSRIIAPGGSLSFVELTPSTPLEASTQYEVGTTDPAQVPATVVFGTFRTGTSADTTPPRIDAVGAATAYKNTNPMSSMCMVSGPWVVVDGVVAADPARPSAQLLFGVWLADASGAIDTKKPPTALVTARDGQLTIGQTSLCDHHSFPLPQAPSVLLGIAAVDEAGNASAVRRVRVDLAGARLR